MSITPAEIVKNGAPAEVEIYVEPDGFDFRVSPLFSRKAMWATSPKIDTKTWREQHGSLYGLGLALIQHGEGRKGSRGAVMAARTGSGRRQKVDITGVELIPFDIDDGTPRADVLGAVNAAGYAYFAGSSSSDGSCTFDLAHDQWHAYASDHGCAVANPKLEDVQAFLRSGKTTRKTDAVIDALTDVELVQDGAWRLRVTGAAIDKTHVFLIPSRPILIKELGATQREATAAYSVMVQTLAEELGITIDKACLDPSRAFYRPTLTSRRAPFHVIADGDPVDVDTLLAKAKARSSAPRKAGWRASTPQEREIAKIVATRADGLQLAQMIEEHAPSELVHGTSGAGFLEIVCPFDALHTAAGDPDARPCAVTNAGEGCEHAWVKCLTNGCSERSTTEMVAALAKEGYLGAVPLGVLGDPAYDDVDRGKVAVEADSAQPKATRPAKSHPSGLEELDLKRRYYEDGGEGVGILAKSFALVNFEGKTRLYSRENGRLVHRSVADAKSFFGSLRGSFKDGKDKQGRDKLVVKPLVNVLIGDDCIRLCSDVDYDPDCRLPASTFNLWQGLEMEPFPGDWSLIKAHLLYSTCAGDIDLFNNVLDWFAHAVQEPGKKPGYAIVVQGKKGTGKTTIGKYFSKIVGSVHALSIAEPKHLYGSFNAHQAGKLFINCEEVVWGGNKRDEGKLKSIITDSMQLMELKGVDAKQVKTFTRFWMNSNEGHVVPATADERRFLFLTSKQTWGPTEADEKGYFDAIEAEFDAGGSAAWLAELLERDISGFNPYRPPKTRGLVSQVALSLPPEVQWLHAALEAGQFSTRQGEACGETWENDDTLGLTISNPDLSRSFDSHVRAYGGSSVAGGLGWLKVLKAVWADDMKKVRCTGMRLDERGEPAAYRPWGYRLSSLTKWKGAFRTTYGVGFEEDCAHEGETVM